VRSPVKLTDPTLANRGGDVITVSVEISPEHRANNATRTRPLQGFCSTSFLRHTCANRHRQGAVRPSSPLRVGFLYGLLPRSPRRRTSTETAHTVVQIPLCRIAPPGAHPLAVSISMITWHQLRHQCLEHFKQEPSYDGDSVARREFWHQVSDDLSRCGLITQKQRDNWSCPF